MIASGKVASLVYTLKNSSGEVLDQADRTEPFVYLHGSHQIVPGLESALQGLKPGDKKKVTVPPSEGYGEVNPDLKLEVSRTKFPADAQIEPGMLFQTDTADGEMIFLVDSIKGDVVVIDGNHPLAGQTLHFDVEVIEVRDATADEKAHGHAHGAHGHDHDHGDDDDDEE
ncbi:MAG TPA: peptidylprolyl isomerase [Bdellovibrionota bacterium]|jgi:FKBP-type peptidyl-prolyl cis-trans isomerase SlyD|nr:peptidylprolyl isomerase [Bdellovibrionota bacterium]